MEDKKVICNSLLKALQETRQFDNLVELNYEKRKEGRLEIVTAVFANGNKREINVTLDSGWSMLKDIINHIDG